MKEARIRKMARDIEALATNEKIEMWNKGKKYHCFGARSILYNMDDLEGLLSILTLKEILWAAYGTNFDCCEDYFYFDGMGNLLSASEEELNRILDFEEMIIGIERIEGIIFGSVEGIKLFLKSLE